MSHLPREQAFTTLLSGSLSLWVSEKTRFYSTVDCGKKDQLGTVFAVFVKSGVSYEADLARYDTQGMHFEQYNRGFRTRLLLLFNTFINRRLH